jgi:hypothetical protein
MKAKIAATPNLLPASYGSFGISELKAQTTKVMPTPPTEVETTLMSLSPPIKANFSSTQRDRALLAFIGLGGLASLAQLKRKFWPHSKGETTCRQRLYQLERAGYLQANFIQPKDSHKQVVAFNLTKIGAQTLFEAKERHYFYTRLPGKRDCHQQLVAQATRLHLEEKLPRSGQQLVGWKNERELRGEAVKAMQKRLGRRGLVKFGKLGGIADAAALILDEAGSGQLKLIKEVMIEIDGEYYGREFEKKVAEIANFGKPGLWVTTEVTRAERVRAALTRLEQPKNEVDVVVVEEF